MAIFYDTHAHLDDEQFAADLPRIIERARAAGIAKINCIGTDLDSSRKAVGLAEGFADVYAVAGWHPSHATEAPEDIRAALRELAKHPKVVALGETGLDYYRLPSKKHRASEKSATSPLSSSGEEREQELLREDQKYKAKQAELFRQHLEVAAETGLGVVVHERESMQDLLSEMDGFADRVRAVFHCFASDVSAMQRLIGLGSIVSFTGILTFKNGQNMRDTLTATPMDKFMLETDSPYLAPVPYRGKRCEPAYVKEIAEAAAQVKGCTLEELSAATCETARGFFRNFA
jgi:TatD DNase family protein